MNRTTANRIGLAAVILLAPGGFILGATLGVRYLRRRAAESEPVIDARDNTDDTPKA